MRDFSAQQRTVNVDIVNIWTIFMVRNKVSAVNLATSAFVRKLTLSTLCPNRFVGSRSQKPGTITGDLSAALIECGLELIERKGVHALTLREIGKQLGVSRTTAYKHFKDKAPPFSYQRSRLGVAITTGDGFGVGFWSGCWQSAILRRRRTACFVG